MPKSTATEPVGLRPYLHHGVEIESNKEQPAEDVMGTCPFCGRAPKFGVNQADGRYRCVVCGETGNHYTFIRRLHAISSAPTGALESVAADRGVSVETLTRWGLVQSAIDSEWLLPAYGLKSDPEINQLYRWSPVKGKRRLLVTAGMNHCLFGIQLWDPNKPRVYVCEGPWDAMRLEEALVRHRLSGNRLVRLGSPSPQSLFAEANVVAVPGCDTFLEAWADWFGGKEVILLFDNDHPRKNKTTGDDLPSVSYVGLERATRRLRGCKAPPHSVSVLDWGGDGYDSTLKDGYDVRDFLSEKPLAELLAKVRPAPDDWSANGEADGQAAHHAPPPLVCESYQELLGVWREAMYWSDSLDVALSAMLAVVASTKQQGSQIWLRLIGPPGSAKTTLCEAISASEEYAFSVSIQRGFHSGDNQGGEDSSLIPKMDGKTVVMKEGDALLKTPNIEQVLSELRDLYDGTSRAFYRNRKHNAYAGLRITFILAGTKAIRKLNRSSLGDRFLDIIIYERAKKGEVDTFERELLDKVFDTAIGRSRALSDGSPESYDSPERVLAMRKTAGFVAYLRRQAPALLQRVEYDRTYLKEACVALAQLVAFMRARPDRGEEDETEVELATRLTEQFVRMSLLMAVVLGKPRVDAEVMRRVAKVARDTCRGSSFSVVEALAAAPMEPKEIAIKIGQRLGVVDGALPTLLGIGCLRQETGPAASGALGRMRLVYKLTPHTASLIAKLRSLSGVKSAVVAK